ncbi:MAG: MFS transporter [Victivallales bacterium]|nr:MFS transporter [Victivallales bacterium]MBT7163614.1 MFS transporter [Victivallales bacterium]
MRRQWAHLILLTSVHGTVDFLGGIIGPILPAIRDHFSLTLTQGMVVITAMGMACNLMQLVIGGLRQGNRRPFFMYVSLLLAGTFLLVGHLPVGLGSTATVVMLVLIALVSGTGVACGHPEGLRAVHALDRVPQSMASSVFMIGGFLGFSAGAWLASSVVGSWGLGSLVWLLALPAFLLVILPNSGVRVAVEHPAESTPSVVAGRPPFWPLFAIAMPLAICSAFVVNILPSCLVDEYHFKLSFGGASSFAYGMGGAVGALLMGFHAHRKGEIRYVVPMLFASVPLTAAYIFLLEYKWAVLLLPGLGFAVAGSYPLLVSLAKRAGGPGLGHRMAIIVGGVWGTASVVLLASGVVADQIGIHRVLHLTYVCAALAAGLAWRCRGLYAQSRGHVG